MRLNIVSDYVSACHVSIPVFVSLLGTWILNALCCFHRQRGKEWDVIPGDKAEEVFILTKNIDGKMCVCVLRIKLAVFIVVCSLC